MQVEDHGSLSPELGLRLEVEALRHLERAPVHPTDSRGNERRRVRHASRPENPAASAGERFLLWESTRPAVILPRHARPEEWVRVPACASRRVPLLHRESGGGAVVVGPGCLNIALVLTLSGRSRLAHVERSYEWLLGKLVGVLGMGGITVRSTDLAIHDRKFAGHAQRRRRGVLLHHGVLLYDSDDFDLDLLDALLREPSRRPAWRGNRTHREFLTNAPLARAEIVRRLGRLPAALEPPGGESRHRPT